MSEQTIPYIEEYTNFIKNYGAGQVSGEQVGELVVRMAQYFAENNLKLVMADRKLALTSKKVIETADESTGKPMTVSKAEILINATDEAYERSQAKAHLGNIEQMINALKCLQKGLTNEYSHMSN